ncbi:MAG TPA: Sir2 family NAD-dependent protein deacetylase [Nitrospirota bacterium]|nr:Sir2 family NAD-dependent protein deacetylase [Nitrospirota bacterium]
MDLFSERMIKAAIMVRNANRITAFTGAGISTESGISDFRSPGGVWDRFRVISYQEFLASYKARIEYWVMRKELLREMKHARPNNAHRILANFEKNGKLTCIITQNIDGLHQDAGSLRVIELHGTNRKAICISCEKTWPIEDILLQLDAGEPAPVCECGGFIKSATISFGQALPKEALVQAYNCASACELFLMIGSSLLVEPASLIPLEAYRNGAKLIFINRTETPYDGLAALIFREDAGVVLSNIETEISRRNE